MTDHLEALFAAGAQEDWDQELVWALLDQLETGDGILYHQDREQRTEVPLSEKKGAEDGEADLLQNGQTHVPALLEELARREEERGGLAWAANSPPWPLLEQMSRAEREAEQVHLSQSGPAGGSMASAPLPGQTAPLSADPRQVDLAFQRDSRRYDHGFTLY